MHNGAELIGQVFGRLTVLNQDGVNKHRKRQWRCSCDCGNEIVVDTGSLRSGNTRSCGCLQKDFMAERSRLNARFSTPPKMWDHPLRAIWYSMMVRCYVEENRAYPNYGGRGITVCDEWHSFDKFVLDMSPRPGSMSIDRIDNNKGYSPENCRWVTNKQQNRNKRSNRILEYNGESKTLSEWAELLGIPYSSLSARVNKLGWSIDRALSMPLRGSQ